MRIESFLLVFFALRDHSYPHSDEFGVDLGVDFPMLPLLIHADLSSNKCIDDYFAHEFYMDYRTVQPLQRSINQNCT